VPSPVPTPSPVPPPTPSATCNVGDNVQCPGSGGAQCAGSQCCPDGSICPSAPVDFTGCTKDKVEDCTGQGLPQFV
jgi:hypothetical protein